MLIFAIVGQDNHLNLGLLTLELQKRREKWEKVKQFRLTPDVWNIDDGHLTPTMKLRRKIVREKYIDLYNDIYGH